MKQYDEGAWFNNNRTSNKKSMHQRSRRQHFLLWCCFFTDHGMPDICQLAHMGTQLWPNKLHYALLSTVKGIQVFKTRLVLPVLLLHLLAFFS